MKRLWIAAALLLVLFTSALAHSASISGFSRELTAVLESAEDSAESGEWERAEELTRSAMEQWQRRDAYLHITLRHSDTDAVYTGFRTVAEFLECREAGEYSAANAQLIAQLELLAEAERLSWKNIL